MTLRCGKLGAGGSNRSIQLEKAFLAQREYRLVLEFSKASAKKLRFIY